MFGTIPASGFFIRHARQVKLNNVFIGFLNPDYRPLIWASDVDELKIHDLEAKQETGVKAFELHDVTHFETQHCEALMKN
jgi:hypothetical protein